MDIIFIYLCNMHKWEIYGPILKKLNKIIKYSNNNK